MKLIIKASLYGLVPGVAGILLTPFIGVTDAASVIGGAILGALAFIGFLGVLQIHPPKTFKQLFPIVMPITALLAVGVMGTVGLVLVKSSVLSSKMFVFGLLASTIFCQIGIVRQTSKVWVRK